MPFIYNYRSMHLNLKHKSDSSYGFVLLLEDLLADESYNLVLLQRLLEPKADIYSHAPWTIIL